jgi:hypothetical protein
LEPVPEDMLRQFPFRIQGFHSDNGSEFLNKTVASSVNYLCKRLWLKLTEGGLSPTSASRFEAHSLIVCIVTQNCSAPASLTVLLVPQSEQQF